VAAPAGSPAASDPADRTTSNELPRKVAVDDTIIEVSSNGRWAKAAAAVDGLRRRPRADARHRIGCELCTPGSTTR
jgi:hypothetical protein